jgi:hypothetical protein
MGGSDLTVSDSFAGSIVAGWLVANTVIGYSSIDHLFLKKNVTSDLERWTAPPDLVNDVAVSYEEMAPVETNPMEEEVEDMATADPVEKKEQ